MQTRRDQLQAYKFQNRRALAALITGEPNVVDPPMRRLTITTISGVMIAVLITVGFTVFGLIRPKAGDSWKEGGAIIVEEDTGATFVYRDDKLYPVINYTSGVLTLGGSQRAKTIVVTSDDIRGAARGPQIGIAGLPSTLPDAGSLVSSKIAACSRQQVVTGSQVGVRVSVHLGDDLTTQPVAADDGVLVDTGNGSQQYLLYDGRRLAIGPDRVATALNYSDKLPLQVGHAFLDSIPQGTNLRAPRITGAGQATNLTGVTAKVGQLITTPDGRDYVAMPDGRSPVTEVQRALLQTLPIGPGGTLLDPVKAASNVVLQLPDSKQWQQIANSQLAGLPGDIPDLSATPADRGGLCAQFRDGADEPRFASPTSQLPSFQVNSVSESSASQRGFADSVTLPPGRAALVRAINSSTIFLIGDSGKKFAVTNNELLGGFGYGPDDATELPAAFVNLVPRGPALDRNEAARPVSN